MNTTDQENAGVSYERIVEAYNRINPILMRTPVHVSSTADHLVGKKIYFKCENFQKTGSFKARGALNSVLAKISRSSNATNYSGCITHSSGNHGTALAWAAKYENLPCTIVVPKNTPEVKVQSILEYGAQLEFCENSPVSRAEVCERISREQNLLIIPPYDDYDIMCGQGTLAFEFLEQVPHLDAIVVAISGGGLISGISVCAKRIKPSIRIIGVEPEGKRLAECLRRNERNIDQKPTAYLNTLAEGIRTEQCGQLTFGVLSQHLKPDDIITVTDQEMIEATKFVFTRMKMVVELAAGAAVAAAFKMKEEFPELKHVGVVLCGGNIDINNLPWKANQSQQQTSFYHQQQHQHQQTRIKSPTSSYSSGGGGHQSTPAFVTKWTCMVCLSKHTDKTTICTICGSSKPPAATSTSPSSSLSSTSSTMTSTNTPINFSKYSSNAMAAASSTSPSNQLFASSAVGIGSGSSVSSSFGINDLGIKHKLNQPLQISTAAAHSLMHGGGNESMSHLKTAAAALLSSPAMSNSPNRYLKTWTCVHCQFCNDSLKVVCMNCRWPKSKSTTTTAAKQLNLDAAKSDEAEENTSSGSKRTKLASVSEAPPAGKDDKEKTTTHDSVCSSCKSPMRSSQEQQSTPAENNAAPAPAVEATAAAPKPSLSQLFGGETKWSCGDCLASNPDKLDKCACCSAAKPSKQQAGEKKPAEAVPALTPANSLSALFANKNASKWDCSTCLSKNDADKTQCACCMTPKAADSAPKPAASTAAPSLSASLAGLSSGKWECSTCMIKNEASKDKCAACTADKPGASSAKAAPSLPTLATNSSINLLNKPISSETQSTIKFGTSSSSSFSGPISFGNTSSLSASSSSSSSAGGLFGASSFAAAKPGEIKLGLPTLATTTSEPKPASQETGGSTSFFKFGASNTASAPTSFGQSTAAPAQATITGSSLFGTTTTTASTTTLDFSAKPAASQENKPAAELPKLMFGSSFGSTTTTPAASTTGTSTLQPFTFGASKPAAETTTADKTSTEPVAKFSFSGSQPAASGNNFQSTPSLSFFGSGAASTGTSTTASAAAISSSTVPSLFGSSTATATAPAPSTSFFGGFGKPTDTTSTSTTLPTSSSIFGGLSSSTTGSQEAPKPSLFGSSTTSSIFGAPSTTATASQPSTTATAASSSSFFGAPKTSGSIFGGLGASSTTTQQALPPVPSASLFGGSAIDSKQQSTSLFGGGGGSATMPTSQTTLFGGSASTTSNTQPSISFPSSLTSAASTPFKTTTSSSFGLPPSTPSTNSILTSSASTNSGFGAPSQASTGFNFSMSAQQPQQQQPAAQPSSSMLNMTPSTQGFNFNQQPSLNLNFGSTTPAPSTGGVIQFSAGGGGNQESTPEPRKFRKATRRR